MSRFVTFNDDVNTHHTCKLGVKQKGWDTVRILGVDDEAEGQLQFNNDEVISASLGKDGIAEAVVAYVKGGLEAVVMHPDSINAQVEVFRKKDGNLIVDITNPDASDELAHDNVRIRVKDGVLKTIWFCGKMFECHCGEYTESMIDDEE